MATGIPMGGIRVKIVVADTRKFTRHILTKAESKPSVFLMPLDKNKNLVTYKGLVLRSGSYLNHKVGAFGSGSRIGQGLQAVGSIATPGDFSDVRSPIRSRLYSALTPGGGRGLPRRGGTRGYRCSEGYQFGGRFTDARYSTCGRRLFDIANLGRTIGDAIQNVLSGRGIPTPAGQAVSGQLIRGQQPGGSLVQSRQPNIPKVGAANPQSLQKSVDSAVQSLIGKPDGFSYLVRRDGYALQPVVSAAVLRTVPDNRNMEGATYLMSATKPDSIGKDELGLLSNTGVTSLKYVLPNGSELSLSRSRDLTIGERRKLGRTVNQASSIDVTTDPAARLKAVASESGGGIAYSEKFVGIDKPDDIVSAGGGKNVRRWVVESFKTPSKKPQKTREVASDDSQLTDKITSLNDAVKHLDNNGDIAKISPKILSVALNKTESFKSTKLNDSKILHERADGKAFFEMPSKNTFEHIGAKVASDVQKQLDLQAPSVHLMGEGTRRPYLLDHPRNIVGDKSLKSDAPLSSVDPGNMLSLALSDWLTDERLRTPGNVMPFKTSSGNGVMATSNRTSGLAGLLKAQISQRQKLGLDDIMSEARKSVYSKSFANLQLSQRKLLLAQLDKLIKQADSFNWDEYYSRLMIDGELSAAEKAHLRIVQSIYGNRLEVVKNSKEQFLKVIGA